MSKCERYALIRFWVLLAHVKSIVLANSWLINNKFYVLLIKNITFEVTSQYFAYFISIASLVFENDKWTFWGCFGHFNMYHLLKWTILHLQLLKLVKSYSIEKMVLTFKLPQTSQTFYRLVIFYFAISSQFQRISNLTL